MLGWFTKNCDMDFNTSAYVQVCSPPQYVNLMERIVKIESSGNPFAIGVVGARLARQPRNLSEAVATAKYLSDSNYNFSIGLSQINKLHFQRLEWANNLPVGFDACRNIAAGAEVLNTCFVKANNYFLKNKVTIDNNSATRMALSCYYSGDLFLGERLGYVNKVLNDSSINHIFQPPKRNVMDYSYEAQ